MFKIIFSCMESENIIQVIYGHYKNTYQLRQILISKNKSPTIKELFPPRIKYNNQRLPSTNKDEQQP